MRRTHIALSLGLAATSLAIAGCPFGVPYQVNQSPVPTAPPFNSQAETTALDQLIDSDAVGPYFDPNRLVNDGVGIFSTDAGGDSSLPRRWGRSYPRQVQTTPATASISRCVQLAIQSDAIGDLTADATYSLSRDARFVADYAWLRKLSTKSYRENALRTARFVKQADGWHLDSLSPMVLSVPNGQMSIDMVRLTPTGASAYAFQPGALVLFHQAPTVQPSQGAKVEVRATYHGPATSATPYHLFLSLPPARDRIELHDDGQNGDLVSGDGVYSATFDFPAAVGLGHLVIDAVSSTTFKDLGNNSYDALVWGVSYLVQGGGAR